MCNRYIKQERKNGAKETFEEIMAKNFSKIIEAVKPQTQETERRVHRLNLCRHACAYTHINTWGFPGSSAGKE